MKKPYWLAGVLLFTLMSCPSTPAHSLTLAPQIAEDKDSGTIRVHYLVGSRREHPMNAKSLKALVPRIADSDIYICGPAPLVESVKAAAAELGVPKNRFHDEAFEFHSS